MRHRRSRLQNNLRADPDPEVRGAVVDMHDFLYIGEPHRRHVPAAGTIRGVRSLSTVIPLPPYCLRAGRKEAEYSCATLWRCSRGGFHQPADSAAGA